MIPDHAAFTDAQALRTKRAEVEAAVADLIDLLDAIDAATADVEPDADVEAGGDDELSLGSPERHPTRDRHLLAGMVHTDTSADCRQTHWAAGLNLAPRDEGESEAGYDLPEGDDERCASDVIDENTLGAPENHLDFPDQRRWGQGEATECEAVNEDGSEEYGSLGADVREANRDAAHEALDKVDAIRRRKGYAITARHSLDDVVIVDPELFMWPKRRSARRALRL